jgi:pilus assembly protein Flp/PilA
MKGNKMLISLKERGQGMVEYALILVLVAVLVLAALTIMGPLVADVFSTINASL